MIDDERVQPLLRVAVSGGVDHDRVVRPQQVETDHAAVDDGGHSACVVILADDVFAHDPEIAWFQEWAGELHHVILRLRASGGSVRCFIPESLLRDSKRLLEEGQDEGF